MSTLQITIGGKEVYLTPVRPTHPKPPTAASIADHQDCESARQRGRLAIIFGLLAAFGLLVILIAWLSRRRCKA